MCVKHTSNGSSHSLNRSSHTGALRGSRDSTEGQRSEIGRQVQGLYLDFTHIPERFRGSDKVVLVVRTELAAGALRVRASLLRVEPTLLRGGAGAGLLAALRADEGAADELCETQARVLAVLRLRAMRARVDDEDVVIGHPAAGQRAQSIANVRRERGSADVVTQLHRRRYLVDVLSAGTRRADEALLEFTVVDHQSWNDLERHQRLTPRCACRPRFR